MSLDPKRSFGLIWQVFFKLECLFYHWRSGTFFEFELVEKSPVTIILDDISVYFDNI